ncbi:hypothetical protein D3C79_924460 [compost metagenome]
MPFTPFFQAFAAIAGSGLAQAQVPQLLRHQHQVGRVVVDHQHLQPGIGYIHVIGFQHLRRQCVDTLQRYAEANLRAEIRHALDAQACAHHFAQVPADGQAQARACASALAMWVGLNEGVEQALQVIVVNANAGVTHFQFQAWGR